MLGLFSVSLQPVLLFAPYPPLGLQVAGGSGAPLRVDSLRYGGDCSAVDFTGVTQVHRAGVFRCPSLRHATAQLVSQLVSVTGSEKNRVGVLFAS